MAIEFPSRIRTWRDQALKEIKERGLWALVMSVIGGLLYDLAKHRVLEAANHFIDAHIDFGWLKPAIFVLQSSALLHPAIVALVMFLAGIFAIILHAYVVTKPDKQASIDVRMRELYRKPPDNYNEAESDLFLRVRLELTSSGAVKILASRFELSKHGAIDTLGPIDDLDEWEALNWEAKQGVTSYGLAAVPSILRKSEPAEGWLHFKTGRMTGQMLETCTVRVIIQTSGGSGYSEHEADPMIWNPQKISISRKIGGQQWSP